MPRRQLLALTLVLALVSSPVPAQEAEEEPVLLETMAVDGPILAWDRLGGVTVDLLGYVYTTSFAEEVFRIAPDGAVEVYADGFYGASGNAIDINGDLLQSAFMSNSVHRIDRRTREVSLVTDENLSGPVAIAVASEGEMFVASCSDNTLVRIDRHGRSSKFSESEHYNCPNGLTFDDRGDLYMVNFQNDHLIRVDAEGNAEIVATIEPPGGWPQRALDMGVRGNAHIVFVNGSFYVTKIKSNTLWRVGRDNGSVELYAGNYQYGLDDGPRLQATMAAPNGIGAFRGKIYINNTDGVWQRLQRSSLVIRTITPR